MTRSANTKRNDRRNGAWNRYLRRLDRITGSRSMRSPYCHNYRSNLPKKTGKGKVVITRLVNTTETAIDPVCEMKVDPRKTPVVTTFKGKKCYFCSEDCRKKFNENPQRFLVSRTAGPTGVWGRYLQRLEEVTGGRPLQLQCH